MKGPFVVTRKIAYALPHRNRKLNVIRTLLMMYSYLHSASVRSFKISFISISLNSVKIMFLIDYRNAWQSLYLFVRQFQPFINMLEN